MEEHCSFLSNSSYYPNGDCLPNRRQCTFEPFGCSLPQKGPDPSFASLLASLKDGRKHTGPALQATCVELQVQADNMGRRMRRIEQENSKLEARLREAEDVNCPLLLNSKIRIRPAAQTMPASRMRTTRRGRMPCKFSA